MLKRTIKEPSVEVSNRDAIKIQKLLTYWESLKGKGELNVTDFEGFIKKLNQTLKIFQTYRPQVKDAFLSRAVLFWGMWENEVLASLKGKTSLPDSQFSLMKKYSRNFIRLIRKHFERSLIRAITIKTPIEDAEDILAISSKRTYKAMAGITISNHIAELLIQIAGKQKLTIPSTDDINTLYTNVKNKTTDQRIKKFLTRSYRRFEDADKTRNRCAHINEGEPTKQEIEQSISLAKLLAKLV
ncbi:MAG TPA: hypothetical protein VF656_18140 [Pyrinomonadaceae bacterium]|jgi:hypothetical protein